MGSALESPAEIVARLHEKMAADPKRPDLAVLVARYREARAAAIGVRAAAAEAAAEYVPVNAAARIRRVAEFCALRDRGMGVADAAAAVKVSARTGGEYNSIWRRKQAGDG